MAVPLTPGQAIESAKRIADIYGAATAELVRIVARRANAGIAEPRLATTRAQLSELVKLRREAEALVARVQTAGPREATRLVQQAYTGGLRAVPGAMVAVNQRTVAALASEAVGALRPVGPQMLRWADDVYRAVAAETAALSATGALTRREATARALDRYAAMGVTGFTDRAGGTWRIESYAEMSTRTATTRAHLAGKVDRLTGQGRDLVVVSDSPDECELCRPWESQVLSLSGTDPERPALATATSGGLFHPNCTHTVDAYTPGLTRLPEARANPEGYAARQRQRTLERRIRESKRRVAAAEEFGPGPVLDAQRRLLARRQEALARHLAATGRRHKAVTSAFRTRIPVPARPSTSPQARFEALDREAVDVGRDGYMSDLLPDFMPKPLPLDSPLANAISRYVGVNYRQINEAMRAGRRTGDPDLDAMADLLRDTIAGYRLPKTVRAWRGVDDADAVLGPDDLTGKVITDKAFMSLTTDEWAAASFRSTRRGATFEVVVPQGSHVAPINPSEAELLAAPGSRLRVIREYRDEDDHRRIVALLEQE